MLTRVTNPIDYGAAIVTWLAYARQQKPSEWIEAQRAFIGGQGKAVLDPDFDIDDGGLPHEKPVLPSKK